MPHLILEVKFLLRTFDSSLTTGTRITQQIQRTNEFHQAYKYLQVKQVAAQGVKKN